MADTIHFRIRRQDGPASPPYWQEFRIPYRAGHNVVSSLMAIRETPVTADGERVAPVAWESNCMEEVCGSCSMRVNGGARQACSALVGHAGAAHRARAAGLLPGRPRPEGRPRA